MQLIKKFWKQGITILLSMAGLAGLFLWTQKAVENKQNCKALTQGSVSATDLITDFDRKFYSCGWHDMSKTLPKGDGHNVLIIPGFMNNDFYMSSLAKRITEQGYQVHGWDNGILTRATQEQADAVSNKIDTLYRQNGGQKISLVGYSLGGVFAREAARKHPEKVRDVITLSAPFRLDDPRVTDIHSFFQGETPADKNLSDLMKSPPPVPTIAIYSKNDAVVDWKTALNPQQDALTFNVESSDGHLRMPFSKQSALLVLQGLGSKKHTQ